jgi:hypothetical protein
MHILMCLISGAPRKPRFSQATLKNGMEAFFNILLGSLETQDGFGLQVIGKPVGAELTPIT